MEPNQESRPLLQSPESPEEFASAVPWYAPSLTRAGFPVDEMMRSIAKWCGKRWRKVGHTATILRIDSTSMELARVIARASTTIPMRLWSVGSGLVVLEAAVTSMDTGGDSGQGDGDDERACFFPVFLRGFDAGCSSNLISAAEPTSGVSTLDFLETRTSMPPIDRRFTDVLIGLEAVSTSVKSDSGVECLESSSRIGDEERHVKGEERREGDGDRDLDREVERFGVGGIDKGDPGTRGDGGETSGTVVTGSSSRTSGISVWGGDVSFSRTFSKFVAGGVEIGDVAVSTLTTSSVRLVGDRGSS